MLQPAYAKINLFLHVGLRRDDGFHPLQSLAVFSDAGDRLEIAAAEGLSLAVKGRFAAGLAAQDDNLVLRAARALGPGRGAAMTLTKNLPVASGIGGGSADAAAALRGLCDLWSRPAGDDHLRALAADLGSDIPVCVASRPAFMEGRGEILREVEQFARMAMLLVNPGVAVPTRDVFAALKDRSGADRSLPRGRFRDAAELLRFLENTNNDLQAPACVLQPVIGVVLEALAVLPGALFTRMSGSGATCFALFADDASCAQGAASIAARHPDWWVAPTFVPDFNIAHENPGRDIGPTDAGL